MSRVCNERMEVEKTAHVLGTDYVKMILSDMTEEKELYPGWNNSVCDREELQYSDSIEMDWDGRHNPNDEII